MTTLPPPSTKNFPEDSIETRIYKMVDEFEKNIPIQNDRYRLSYCIFKYLNGEGDNPEVLVKSTKIKIEGIEKDKLASQLNSRIEDLKK